MRLAPTAALVAAIAAPLVVWAVDTSATTNSRPALVRFHTACASCHAWECSGRLSFQSGKSGARHHIKRYAPSADDAMVRELFVLLSTTKRNCRAELPALAAPQTRWTARQLREWFNPDVDAWFIPLGNVGPPGLTVELEVGAGVEAGRLQVLDAELETLAEAPLREGLMRVRVAVPATGPAFLRVRAAKDLLALRLVP